MIQSRKWIIFIGFILAIMVGACTTESDVTPTATLRGAIVPTRIPTDTLTPTSTSTNTPTPTVTPSNTPTPSPTASPTSTLTNTPTATLTPTLDRTQVASLIEDGDTFRDLGSLDRAIEQYTNAIDLDPTNIDAYFGRGLSYYENEQYDLSLEDFNTILAIDSTDIDAYFNRGLANAQLDNLEAATEDFSTVVTLDPADFEAHYELGLLQFDLDQPDAGFESLQTAIDLNPTFAEAYGTRGVVYYLSEDYENALPDLENYALYAGSNATQDMLNLLEDTRAQVQPPNTPPPPTPEPPPPTRVVAQQTEPETIEYGDSATGEITAEVYEYRYEFEASANDKIDIKLIANEGNLDPFLILLDEAGTQITENDDDPNNTGRDSFLQGFIVPSNGIYMIVATRFQQELGSTAGTFTLTLELSPEPSGTPIPTSIPESDLTLEYGDSASGQLDNTTFAVIYEFTAEQGDVIDIQMIATDEGSTLDPLLILTNDDGDTLIENDDDTEGTGRDSYIRDYEIPTDGTYTIIATRFQQELGSTTGSYEVTLTLTDTVATGDSELLEYGHEYMGEITSEAGSNRIIFEAVAGDVVNISMQGTSGDLDPLLILLDSEGNEIIRNDDDEQGIGRDSFIREFEIPRDGTYTIVATRFQEDIGSTTGRFNLLLELVVLET